MFDDDLPKAKSGEFPRNLETLSVPELQDYTRELQDEINRVQADIERKKQSQSAAESIFKS